MKKSCLSILAIAIPLGSILIFGPVLFSWYLLKTTNHAYMDRYESMQSYFMSAIGDGTNIAKKITDNYMILTSQRAARDEPIIILQCLVNRKNYQKAEKNADKTKCAEVYYQELIRRCVKWEENEPENVFIPLDQMAEQKIVQRQDCLVRLAARLFKNYTICKIDILFGFLGAGVPEKPKQYNAFVMCYEPGLLSVHKFLVDENNETSVFQDTHKIKSDEREATTIYMDIIVKMLTLSFREEEKPTNLNKDLKMDGEQDGSAQENAADSDQSI